MRGGAGQGPSRQAFHQARHCNGAPAVKEGLLCAGNCSRLAGEARNSSLTLWLRLPTTASCTSISPLQRPCCEGEKGKPACTLSVAYERRRLAHTQTEVLFVSCTTRLAVNMAFSTCSHSRYASPLPRCVVSLRCSLHIQPLRRGLSLFSKPNRTKPNRRPILQRRTSSRDEVRRWCREKFLSQPTLERLDGLREQFRQQLAEVGFASSAVPSQRASGRDAAAAAASGGGSTGDGSSSSGGSWRRGGRGGEAPGKALGGGDNGGSSSSSSSRPGVEDPDLNSGNMALVQSALVAGLYPHVAAFVRPDWHSKTRQVMHACMHAGGVSLDGYGFTGIGWTPRAPSPPVIYWLTLTLTGAALVPLRRGWIGDT